MIGVAASKNADPERRLTRPMSEQRSMDDVLASIRRIVTEEERGAKAEAAPQPEDSPQGPIPLPTAFRRPGAEPSPFPSRQGDDDGPEEDGEFVLTSSMRAQAEAAEEALRRSAAASADMEREDTDYDEDDALEPEEDEVSDSALATLRMAGSEMSASPEPEFEAEMEPQAETPLTLDEEQLSDLIRGIIQQELTGSFGATLSRNIQRLVQDEVRKALDARD